MITRDSHTRARLSARAPRTLDPVKGVRGELHAHVGKHRPVSSEARDVVPQNLPDQSGTVVLIGFTIPGLGGLGKIALPFIYCSFHAGRDTLA